MTQQNHQPHTIQPMLSQEAKAAIYTRRATAKQQTTPLHHDDLFALAQVYGYSQEQVTFFEETFVSGRATIVKRKAFSAMLTAITVPDQAPIRSIFVSSEERLLRDAENADIALFLKTCSEHGVMLITPTHQYDFTQPGHVALFRFSLESAYQYATEILTSRLQTGKRRKRERNQNDQIEAAQE